ncbi:MAG TPA: hydroxymethylbilane synthase [Porticoccaceae bacterium]|nr:hydroxymethylbilane synthase [Porticoccaceae bacterium]
MKSVVILRAGTVTDCVRIATRKSPLALWQAEFVRAQLLAKHVGLRVELVAMTTRGDRLLDTTLAKVGGKGLFIKELEHALFDRRADIAVHSLKDVPMSLPEGLHLGAVCPRGNAQDALVSNTCRALSDLPDGAVVGTSSLRRRCQLLAAYPNLEVKELRGNVNTRLQKLDEGAYHAIILACAGLERLDMAHRIAARLPVDDMLPAAGQGAVAIECRKDDAFLSELLAPLHDANTAMCVAAERAVTHRLDGGCQMPVAAYAEFDQGCDQLFLRALVGSIDGRQQITAQLRGSSSSGLTLGQHVAEKLLAQGASTLLAEVYEGLP